jgi:exonuclease III
MFTMQRTDPQILSLNVRGLNVATRCLTVHDTLAATHCQIACCQETKLHSIDDALAAFLGAYRLQRFAFKSTEGTKGGTLLL